MFLSIIMLFGIILMPFSLIICKVHTKRENSGSRKSEPEKATLGHLFCTTPNELKLHGNFLWII